jgi:hypothetical protein
MEDEMKGFLVGLFMLLTVVPAAAATSAQTDPDFLNKIYNHQFDKIPNTTGSHIDMISVNRAFTEYGCVVNDRSGIDDSNPIARFAKLQNWITSDVSSMAATQGRLVMDWPNYKKTVVLIDSSGRCNSKWSQRTFKNVNLLIIERSDNTPVRSWRDSPLNQMDGGSGAPTYNRKTRDQ